MLPKVTEDYFHDFKKRMDDAETAKHRKWDFKGRGRHRDLLQVRHTPMLLSHSGPERARRL
jgi:hypothetical protein